MTGALLERIEIPFDTEGNIELEILAENAGNKADSLNYHAEETAKMRGRYIEKLDRNIDEITDYTPTDENDKGLLDSFRRSIEQIRNERPEHDLPEDIATLIKNYKDPEYANRIRLLEDSLSIKHRRSKDIASYDTEELSDTLRRLSTINTMVGETKLKGLIEHKIAILEGPQSTRLNAMSVFYRQYLPEEIEELKQMLFNIENLTQT